MIGKIVRRCLKALAVTVIVLWGLGSVALTVAWRTCPFPTDKLARSRASPVVTDARGGVMLQRVAADGQWCFPVPMKRISPWLIQATLAVEDERFYWHDGVDGLAVVRAAGQNLRGGRIVSGASTVTMQVCRMMDDRPRTIQAKIIEAFRARQLSRIRTKGEVLGLYLNMAPYGGNLRGVEAAARTYFGKSAAEVSLAEAALLAGLPQSPGRYRPDRHPDVARRRRNFVLWRMRQMEMITDRQRAESRLAPVEPAPPRPRRLGPIRHVAWMALSQRPRGGATTIDPAVQAEAERLATARRDALPDGTKIAVVVVDVRAASILALIGSCDPADPADGQVNGATARRSPGSALKPFLYAAAFEAGRLGADSTVYDVPIHRAGWSPENFDRTFRGAVPAAEALRASLNIPAILIAEAVGLDRCLGLLSAVGIGLPDDARRRGGLAVAVGALEVSLLDLVNGYATIARAGVRRPVRLFADRPSPPCRVLDANVCAVLDDILSSHRRCPHGLERADPDSIPWFMWKTGTSAGRRDAWAVGHNRRYAVGVWVGRFCGPGHVEFVGARAAEPLLADLFNLPALRVADAPPAPKPIAVRHPIGPPRPVSQDLRILRPGSNETFLTTDGKAVVRPQANRTADVQWFLSGQLLPPGAADRLILPPGAYELRCVSAIGESSAVRFTVR